MKNNLSFNFFTRLDANTQLSVLGESEISIMDKIDQLKVKLHESDPNKRQIAVKELLHLIPPKFWNVLQLQRKIKILMCECM